MEAVSIQIAACLCRAVRFEGEVAEMCQNCDFLSFFFCLSWVLEPLLSALLRRMPDLEALQIMQLVNCPESFTPDMRCIMGESPTVRGYFVLAGMNSAGISYGGGAGK